jgi:hypothetical protein
MRTVKAQVHMLPTTEGKLGKVGNRLTLFDNIQRNGSGYGFQHLYFTTDEEIKEGDWCLIPYKNGIFQSNGNTEKTKKDFHYPIYKIVATTNHETWKPSIIKREDGCPFYLQKDGLYQATDEHGTETLNVKSVGVPKIPIPFIEAYIKAYNEGNPIKEVLLETDYKDIGDSIKGEYHIPILKIKPNGYIIVHPVKERMYSRTDVKDILYKAWTTHILDIKEWFNKNYPE